jgi:hypothetical protein
MLRKAENVTFTHRPSFWTQKGPIIVSIGRHTYVGKMPQSEFAERQEVQKRRPITLLRLGDRTYWHFRDKAYWENENLSAGEVYAFLVARDQRRRQQIDIAQATVAIGGRPRGSSTRKRIPDDVKQYVMMRGEGRCQSCESSAELQFDHIILLAMNGSNNLENLQIPCGPCNR